MFDVDTFSRNKIVSQNVNFVKKIKKRHIGTLCLMWILLMNPFYIHDCFNLEILVIQLLVGGMQMMVETGFNFPAQKLSLPECQQQWPSQPAEYN